METIKFVIDSIFGQKALQFNASGLSVTVNAQVDKGDALTLNGVSWATGVMSAFADLFRFNRYAHAEIGLYLYRKLDDLLIEHLPVKGSVGYVTSAYNGKNKAVRALKPEQGIVILGFRDDALYEIDRVEHMPVPPKDGSRESDENTHARRRYCKYLAMDAVLNGRRITVTPFFRTKPGEDGHKHYDRTHAQNWFATWLKSYQMTTEQAWAERQSRFGAIVVNQQLAKTFAAVEKGTELPIDGVTTVRRIDPVLLTITDENVVNLLGRNIVFFRGRNEIAGVRKVTESYLPVLIDFLSKRGNETYSFAFAPETAA